MNLFNCSTALFVKDILIAKEFYSQTLGLNISLDFGTNVIFSCGLTIWEIRDNHIIPEVLGLDNVNNKKVNRFELYFETGNLQSDFEFLKNKNVTFLNEIHEESWGQRTIRFFDPDRHLIEIGESMRQFVSRFHENGLTVEEINKKTSVPVEEIRKLIQVK